MQAANTVSIPVGYGAGMRHAGFTMRAYFSTRAFGFSGGGMPTVFCLLLARSYRQGAGRYGGTMLTLQKKEGQRLSAPARRRLGGKSSPFLPNSPGLCQGSCAI
jgi:hypothetical protein